MLLKYESASLDIMTSSTGDPLADSIIDTLRDPIIVLDVNLRVILASFEFYRTFQVEQDQTVGQRIYDLGNRQWDIPRLRTLLEQILPEKTSFRDFEVEHVFEHIGRKIMLLNARKIRHETKELILLVIEDITDRKNAEELRREAEFRFTEMVKNVRDHAIFLTDPDGTITSWNLAAESVLGYSEGEVLGKNFSLIFTPEDVQRELPTWELRTARERGRAEDERWHVRKGGQTFWALGIVTPRYSAKGGLTGFSKILRDFSERKRFEEDLRKAHDELEGRVQERTAELANVIQTLREEIKGRLIAEHSLLDRTAQLRALAAKITLTEQRERSRIAKILHDQLQQIIVGATFQVSVMADKVDQENRPGIERINELLQECLKASRSLTAELNPPILHTETLFAALEWLVRTMADQHGLEVKLTRSGSIPDLPEDTRLLLFESVRELLLNVAKHAGVRKVTVDLRSDQDGLIRITVRDKGRGFDPAVTQSADYKGGFGHFGIRERLELIGGHMTIESTPQEGTRITLVSPAPTQSSQNENQSGGRGTKTNQKRPRK